MSLSIPTLGAGTFRLKGEDAYNSVKMALEAAIATSIPRRSTAMKKKLARLLRIRVLHVQICMSPLKSGWTN